MRPKRFQTLVDDAYAAALDDSLWERWVHDLTAVMGGTVANFFVIGSGDQPIERMSASGCSASTVEQYQQHWWQHDPQLPFASSITRSTLYRSDEHVDERKVGVAEFMRWQRANGGYDHHVTAIATLGSDGRKAGVSVHRDVDAGPVTFDQESDLRAVLPDIVRAFRLGFQHQAMLASSFWDGLEAQNGDEAMLLLVERGTVIRATDAALSILTSGDGLALIQDRLYCTLPSQDAELTAVVGRAIASVTPSSGAISIRRRSGRRPYVVIAYPLVRPERMLAPLEAAALVRIVDPLRRATGSRTLLRDAFGFTPREAELAQLLIADHSIESAAAAMDIAVPTARIHLTKLLVKTGTSRQVDLAKLLVRLSRPS